ncbi:MAG: TetR/AcrR family transcriptional regulator, partial [Acidimicrobiales bacterium]
MTGIDITSRRDRIRQLTQDEIKTIALRQIAEGGVELVSMNAIAKEMGMSGPALYRYFENRQALLLDVVKDGFESLHQAIMFADSMYENVVDRITAMANAYRTWAQENSELYGLLFSTVIPGVERKSLEPCMTCRDAVMPLVLAIVEYAEVDFT